MAPRDLKVLATQVIDGLHAQLAQTLQQSLERLLQEHEERLLAVLAQARSPGQSGSGDAASVDHPVLAWRRKDEGEADGRLDTPGPSGKKPAVVGTSTLDSLCFEVHSTRKETPGGRSSSPDGSVLTALHMGQRHDSPDWPWPRLLRWHLGLNSAHAAPSGMQSLREARDNELLGAVPEASDGAGAAEPGPSVAWDGGSPLCSDVAGIMPSSSAAEGLANSRPDSASRRKVSRRRRSKPIDVMHPIGKSAYEDPGSATELGSSNEALDGRRASDQAPKAVRREKAAHPEFAGVVVRGGDTSGERSPRSQKPRAPGKASKEATAAESALALALAIPPVPPPMPAGSAAKLPEVPAQRRQAHCQHSSLSRSRQREGGSFGLGHPSDGPPLASGVRHKLQSLPGMVLKDLPGAREEKTDDSGRPHRPKESAVAAAEAAAAEGGRPCVGPSDRRTPGALSQPRPQCPEESIDALERGGFVAAKPAETAAATAADGCPHANLPSCCSSPPPTQPLAEGPPSAVGEFMEMLEDGGLAAIEPGAAGAAAAVEGIRNPPRTRRPSLGMTRTSQAFRSDPPMLWLRLGEQILDDNCQQYTCHQSSHQCSWQRGTTAQERMVASEQNGEGGRAGFRRRLDPMAFRSDTQAVALMRKVELQGHMCHQRTSHRHNTGDFRGLVGLGLPRLCNSNSLVSEPGTAQPPAQSEEEELLSEYVSPQVSTKSEEALPRLSMFSRQCYASLASPLLLRLCGILPWGRGRLGMAHHYGMLLLIAGLVVIFARHFFEVQHGIVSSRDCLGGLCTHLGSISNLVLAAGSLCGLVVMRTLNSQRLLGSPRSLLARYATEKSAERAWFSASSWQSMYLAMLWVGSLIFQIVAMPPEPDLQEVVQACAFVLASFIFMGLVFSILHVSCVLCILLDSYVMWVNTTMDLARFAQEWDRLEALLRKASQAMRWGFLLVQTTAGSLLLCSLTDLILEGHQQLWRFASNALLAQSFILVFSKAAEVTEMCRSVPSLLNSLNLSRDAYFSLEKHFLVEHITYSAAGFYVGGARLTAATALKLTYISILATFGVLTKFAMG